MQVRFLLGPAGSGKTSRCLEEIRAELTASPEGPPLALLAPKQATFQLERQLLADGSLGGYTRLHILSFERLAGFVFDHLHQPRPQLLEEQGRVMVLRALLGRSRDDLHVFHASARQPGLAQQLGLLLRELQRHHLSAPRLDELSVKLGGPMRLGDKLHDLALLLRGYRDWLREHQLQDADCLLDLATELLTAEARNPKPELGLAGVWLDGFAEMTPQELDLLTALVACSQRATLAFCLEEVLGIDPSWLSTWSVVGHTFRRCHERFAALPGGPPTATLLPKEPERTRFAANPVLRHLETHWTRPEPFRDGPATAAASDGEIACSQREDALAVLVCANPEAEAVMAAREILWHVREGGGRFRDCAVILRRWEGYHDVLRRVLRRYDIPFFMDRREPVAHHPLAELTRYALRTVAYNWQQEDWFGALKAGLVPAREQEIDELENVALACGWKGNAWLQPLRLPDGSESAQLQLETLRQRLVPPFQQLADRLGASNHPPTGSEMAHAIRGLWAALDAGGQLEQWSDALPSDAALRLSPLALHSTVWDQMNAWLENVELAFRDEPMPLRDWLPVLEAGLAGLTVGVVPPALDQVLIGTIDRSRNPDLQLALVLGTNESVFPAPAPAPGLLTESDLDELERNGASLGANWRARLGHERYFGYIAFTRPRVRLVVSYSRLDDDDVPLNPSPFIGHLQRLFPGLEPRPWAPSDDWLSSGHVCELAPRLLCARRAGTVEPGLLALESLPALANVRERLNLLAAYAPDDHVSRVLVRKLHGETLRTSVSALEKFAACPFQFFTHAALGAEERKVFEVDQRERGSFQHEVLARFHERVRQSNRKWRDLSPAEARDLVGQVAREVTAEYGLGLFQGDAQSRFAARGLTGALQDFIEVAVGWMAHNRFDPTVVETGFGFRDSRLPAWEIDLGDGCRMAFRGKIDRVDLARDPESGAVLCAVIDYKSSQRKIDPLLLEHGIQIQLPAYLAALCQMPDLSPVLGVSQLTPAGMFYVDLRGSYDTGTSRAEVLTDPATVRREADKHLGRFSRNALPLLDTRHAQGGSGQFSYKLTSKDKPDSRYKDLLLQPDFDALLARVHSLLRGMGRRIYDGEAAVDPYRKGSETACDRCLCRSICRIDPWTHPYRVLRRRTDDPLAPASQEAPPCP